MNTHQPKANETSLQPSAPCVETDEPVENSNSKCSMNRTNTVELGSSTSSPGPAVEEGFIGSYKKHLRKVTKAANCPEQCDDLVEEEDTVDGGMISKRHDDDDTDESSEESVDSSVGPGSVQEDGVRKKKEEVILPQTRVDRTDRYPGTNTSGSASGTRGSTISVSSTASATNSTSTRP